MRKNLKQKKFQNNSKKFEETFCIQIWIEEVWKKIQEKYFEERKKIDEKNFDTEKFEK
jgi:hypothetical protein